MITCIIVDDDQFSVDALKKYAAQIPFLDVKLATTSAIEALQMISNQSIDLLFSDVFMPELNGMDLIKAVKGKCKCVLITAYSDYAVEGFSEGIVHYLTKPVPFPKFLEAAQRVETLINLEKKAIETIAAKPEKEQKYIFVKTGQKGLKVKVNFEDILFIEGMKNYIGINTKDGEKIMTLINMKDFEEALPKDDFVRVHKSYLISIDSITAIEGNNAILGDLTVPIGGTYKETVTKLFVEKVA
jgi:two-component system, LytTR family, response regulator